MVRQRGAALWASATSAWPDGNSSHTLAVLSSEPVTRRAPSGVTATLGTGPVWPLSVACSAKVLASHTLAVLSAAEPVTRRAPSGVTATLHTELVWPLSVASSAKV